MKPGFPHRRTLLVLAALALSAPGLAASSPAPSLPDDMSMGSAKAKVTVVEYASASCPHCARFNNNVFPAFKKKYVDTGKVRYVLREYLTQPVQVAAAGFLLARCSGAAKYFPTLDDFFRSQEELYETGEARRVIMAVGGRAGLSEAQVEECLNDEAARNALNARVQGYVERDKIESTPSFVINGKPLPPSDHEVNLADLDAAIAPLLKGRR